MTFDEIKKEIKLEIKTDKKIKAIWYWGLFSMIGVFILKWIRAKHMHLSEVQDFLQGTLPNFFAATGICASIFVFYKLLFRTDASSSKKINLFNIIYFFRINTLGSYSVFHGFSNGYLRCTDDRFRLYSYSSFYKISLF